MSLTLRYILVWIFLSGITVLSWWIGSEHEGQIFRADLAITIAVILIALIKVRFIAREFMEVRTAPAWIRHLSDAWLATVFVGLLVTHSL